jgi:8-oxo-dGTP pyrophosphatase MutT (NUDIX family)
MAVNRSQFITQFQHARQVKGEADFPLTEPGKPAAVLIPVIENAGRLGVLFTVRAAHLKHHAGQISFPGGKQEPQDKDLIETALRETYEEVGIAAKQVQIIGSLSMYRTVSRYEVLPVIGFVNSPLNLQLDPNEVQSTFEVPLDFLLDQSNHLIHWVKRKKGQVPIYFMTWQEHTIWGATAAFVRNLSNHFKGG